MVGVAQALALIPGTSRSGITLSAGLFAGLDRATAARFAFLLGLPITMAAGLLEASTLVRAGSTGDGLGVIALGVVTSFVAGLAAIRFLVSYLQRRTLLVFVVYRIALGVAPPRGSTPRLREAAQGPTAQPCGQRRHQTRPARTVSRGAQRWEPSRTLPSASS